MVVSLKDVAKAAEVSIMTVSRALRNAPGVRHETRERILRISREVGYLPDQTAVNLVSKRTMTIGVLLPHINQTIFPEVVKGIEMVISPHDYSMILCCSYDKPNKEYREVQNLLSRRVEGIIIAPASVGESKGRHATDPTAPLPACFRRSSHPGDYRRFGHV